MVAHRTHGPLLTSRDLELLVSLFKYRYLSITQIERLHFPSHQTASRRVRLLAGSGYVAPFTVPGFEERLVALAERGAQAVAEHLLVPFPELGWTQRREEPKDYLFLRHFLLATDFRIALTRACATRPDLALLGFIPEHVGEKTPQGGVQKYIRDVVADIKQPQEKIVHTPDGVFALGKDGKAALFFLEIDRGTATLADAERGFLKTIRFYLNYLVSGGYQRYQEDFSVSEPFKAFRVLVLTSSLRRLANIRTLCGRLRFEREHAKRFLWLANQDAILNSDLLEHQWVSLDPHDAHPYTIAPPGPNRRNGS